MRYNPLRTIVAAALILAAAWFFGWREAPVVHAAAEAGTHPARQPVLTAVQSRSLKVGTSELLVLDVPSVVSPRAPMLENQRCYVWRDLEFKTSSLNCVPGDDAAPLAPPPPSFER